MSDHNRCHTSFIVFHGLRLSSNNALKKTICLNDTHTFHGDTFTSSRNVSEKLLLGNHPILCYLREQIIGGVDSTELYY